MYALDGKEKSCFDRVRETQDNKALGEVTSNSDDSWIVISVTGFSGRSFYRKRRPLGQIWAHGSIKTGQIELERAHNVKWCVFRLRQFEKPPYPRDTHSGAKCECQCRGAGDLRKLPHT
jgi:hypothetical protein